MERIFVQLASYRDPECQWTLKDMFEKAEHPERVFAGICWVWDEAQDRALCLAEPCSRPENVRSVFFSLEEGQGLNWARMQAQMLAQGEEYVLQIHTHMRFVQGWDSKLIDQLKRCPSQRAVISTSPPSYTPPDTYPYRETTRASFVTVHSMDPRQAQVLSLAGKLVHKDTPPAPQMRSAFAVGSFMFARSSLMQEVPTDPAIYYYNTELAYSARLWTHGYDVFQPDEYIVFHWYGRKITVPRPHRELSNPRHASTLMRIKHLLRFELATDSSAIAGLDDYALGNQRTMEEFWQFSGINPAAAGAAEHAKKGEWEKAYSDVMAARNKAPGRQPTIFVQIASYRDPECQWTVKDMFDKATFPDRVFMGICWQYDPEEDQDCFKVSVRPHQVRISPFHWKESQGVCWARHQAQALYENEDYVLMIDSHMRFVFGWDELVIKQLQECKAAKPLLSNHPAAYTPPHNLEKNAMPTALAVIPYSKEGDVRVCGGYVTRKPLKPVPGAFIAGGFIFAKGDIIREVPYDPHMYFNQEEMSLCVRLYTHGWDVYSPSEVVAYHCYNVGENKEKAKRRLHWDDNKEWGKLQIRARKRFEHLLGTVPSDDPEVTRDIMRYGLGDVRTVAQYADYTGIDFKNRVASEKALNYGYNIEIKSYMRPNEVQKDAVPSEAGAKVLSFPLPAVTTELPFYIMPLANGQQRILNVEYKAPKDVLIMYDYIEPEICKALTDFADAQAFTDLGVVDYNKSSKKEMVITKDEGRVTHRVDIDGIAASVLNIFNDIYCNRMAPFYNVNFEWYERPQILRYPPGGKYNKHADAEYWDAPKKQWIRGQDRDYSVLLYLNDQYEGGELQFINQNYTIKPKPGMLVAFPSDREFLHAALPTTSGIRYVIVSWAAILGSQRVRPQIPYGSVFVRQKRKG